MLPRGWLALWLLVLLWKFIIISLTQIGIGESSQHNEGAAWEQAVRRMMVHMHAAVHEYRQSLIRARGRGHKSPSPANLNLRLEPLASVDETGA